LFWLLVFRGPVFCFGFLPGAGGAGKFLDASLLDDAWPQAVMAAAG